jgi:hypothetical protein
MFQQKGALVIVNTSLRLVFVASLCVALTGCAGALFFAGAAIGQLLHKATVGQGPAVQSPQNASVEMGLCSEFIGRGIEVTAPVEIAIPTNEGKIQAFEATTWQFEFSGERYAQPEVRSPIAGGTLVITEQSVLLVPPPGAAGVRIPYQVVQSVELNPVVPNSMIVNSCTGRHDVFTFWQRQTNKDDPEAAAAAVAQLKARVAAAHATAEKRIDALE